MSFVIDANVIFSFFKKDSVSRDIILDPEREYNMVLFAPEFVLTEIKRHGGEICSKFDISSADFEVMFSALPLFISVVSKEFFKDFTPRARDLLAPHVKDIPYVALCLSLKNTGDDVCLWSNGRRLKSLEKEGVKVLSTSELLKELKI